MKHGRKIAIGLAGGLALHLSAGAVTSDGQLNPYSAIVDRNVFNLKPVPPPAPPAPTPDSQPTKITLLGIVSGFGPKQVMFKTPVGTPPKETSFALGEGERADDFEVVEINEIAGSVRIKNHGVEEPLTLEKNGMKPTGAAPAVPTLPGLPGGQRIPPPAPTPGQPVTSGIPAPAGGSTVTTFGTGTTTPTRPLRVSAMSSGTPGVVGTGRATTQTQVQPQQPVLTPEQSAATLELNRARFKNEIDQGLVPPLPPPHPMLPQ